MRKTKAFCTGEKNCIKENFQVSTLRLVKWEVTPFYESNVTVGCIKNAPEYEYLSKAMDFECRKCSDSAGNTEDDKNVKVVI